MASGPTYYDFFGVSRSASGEQIRAAYLWLMKQHHPDLTDQDDKQRSADFAAILNRSYDVLKDPAKRARYDAFLDQDPAGLRKRRRALLTGQTSHQRRSRWDGSSKGAAALACMILLLVGAGVWLPMRTQTYETETASAAPVIVQPSAPPTSTRDSAVRQQVQLAMRSTPQEAELLSGHCFAMARAQSSLARTEMCVIFDDAYVEWNQAGAQALSDSIYFNDAVVRLRHGDAMSAVRAGDGRLDQLRQITVNALLTEIRSQVNASLRSRPSELGTLVSNDNEQKLSR